MQRYFNVLTTQYIERNNINNNNKNLSMMKKNYLLAVALALTAMVSCTDESFVGDQGLKEANEGVGAISFNLNVPAITRADKTGAAAATDLNEQFIVYAEKAETADGAAPAAGKLVFQNYKVVYTANSAYTTTSNTKNWEYVGQAWVSNETSHITTSTTDAQTIKYWDWGADTYTFTAVSALPTDISTGKVTITKTTAATTGNLVYDKGYTVALTADANLDKLFFSERKVIEKSDGASNTDRTATNKYGGNVTLRFHNAASKVRVAMYETVPGHSVTINKFTVDNDGDNPAFGDMVNDVTANFAANFQNCAEGTAGTLTVKYYNTGDVQNHPTVSFSGTAAKVLALGTQLKENVTIGESITGATYDRADGGDADSEPDYTTVFPKENNTQNLKLKVSYTLTAPVTNETITVTDATAEIPADYLKWKPGYAYTYIFKISDNTNGSTGTPGTNPAGLYPITFDAVETIDADGQAEYITTVSEPSITTFGVNRSTGKYVHGGSEYAAGSDIYATIMDASAVKDFTLGTDVNVYLVTTADATNFPITEASVAEALAEISTGTKKITYVNKNEDGSTSFTRAPEEVTTVPGEDGVDITGTHALKLTGAVATAANTAYAIEYIKTAATYHTAGSTFTLASEEEFNTEVSNNGKIYTNAEGTTELIWSVYNASEESKAATYYRRTSVNSVGTYAYKVIRVN